MSLQAVEKMKKLVNQSSTSKGEVNTVEVPMQKERHIVSWSQEEDDIMREQIRLHGTENWTIIASKFKDKTTRQCRRRWFTYLNSDFKKGGWSPEEDMLLCEAQKIFGNKWTEIAKVVSGRTDNAVKNRFTTLCKKRTKREAMAKGDGSTSYINLNNKMVIFCNRFDAEGGSNGAAAPKKPRLAGECGLPSHLPWRSFQELAQSVNRCVVEPPNVMQIDNTNEASTDECANKDGEGTFLKRDDPKVLALLQQAELLSSLAIKVNTEKSSQSRENAWAALQDFMKQSKEMDISATRDSDADFRMAKFNEFVHDSRSCNEGSITSRGDRDAYDSSSANSEYSSGSTLDRADEENGICSLSIQNDVKNKSFRDENGVKDYTEFDSPVRVTLFFGALAASVPSPKFSESEKNFLMKTLGMESTSPKPIVNPSQPPSCKRSLLHCL